jgi:predicted transcriptional regulator
MPKLYDSFSGIVGTETRKSESCSLTDDIEMSTDRNSKLQDASKNIFQSVSFENSASNHFETNSHLLSTPFQNKSSVNNLDKSYTTNEIYKSDESKNIFQSVSFENSASNLLETNSHLLSTPFQIKSSVKNLDKSYTTNEIYKSALSEKDSRLVICSSPELKGKAHDPKLLFSSLISMDVDESETWACEACLVPNDKKIMKCVACSSDRKTPSFSPSVSSYNKANELVSPKKKEYVKSTPQKSSTSFNPNTATTTKDVFQALAVPSVFPLQVIQPKEFFEWDLTDYTNGFNILQTNDWIEMADYALGNEGESLRHFEWVV